MIPKYFNMVIDIYSKYPGTCFLKQNYTLRLFKGMNVHVAKDELPIVNGDCGDTVLSNFCFCCLLSPETASDLLNIDNLIVINHLHW